MATMGYAMYCKLMREAVATTKGKHVEGGGGYRGGTRTSRRISRTAISKTRRTKWISTSWSPRSKRWATRNRRQREIADRYGKIPKEVNNLIVTAAVKALRPAAGIASVIKKADRIELKYDEKGAPGM